MRPVLSLVLAFASFALASSTSWRSVLAAGEQLHQQQHELHRLRLRASVRSALGDRDASDVVRTCPLPLDEFACRVVLTSPLGITVSTYCACPVGTACTAASSPESVGRPDARTTTTYFCA